MSKLLKMVTGLVAKLGYGFWLRIILFAAMITGTWHLLLWVPECAYHTALISGVCVVLAIVNFFAFICAGIMGNVLDLDLQQSMRRLPLTMWAQITHNGVDVRLWAILVWPFLLPIEMFLCAAILFFAVSAIIGRIFNIRIKCLNPRR